MDEGDSCTNCLYQQIFGGQSYCRRYPPRICAEDEQRYPFAGSIQWCGEWRPKAGERRERFCKDCRDEKIALLRREMDIADKTIASLRAELEAKQCGDCWPKAAERRATCPTCRSDPNFCGLAELRRYGPKSKPCDCWRSKADDKRKINHEQDGEQRTYIAEPGYPRRVNTWRCVSCGSRNDSRFADYQGCTAPHYVEEPKKAEECAPKRDSQPPRATYVKLAGGGMAFAKTWECSNGTRNDLEYVQCQACGEIRPRETKCD